MNAAYLTEENIQSFIRAALAEDIGEGDHSTLGAVPVNLQSQARLLLKEEGVLAGVSLALKIFQAVDPALVVDVKIGDGQAVRKGDVAFTVSGKARSMLTAERLVLNCMHIAHAIGLAKDFIGDDAFCVVLGDNILRGDPLEATANTFEQGSWGAGTLLYRVPDPERFGVAELDADGKVVGFEEKPTQPKSDLIPIGVYFLRPDAFDVIEHLAPSGRGEFEITDVLNHYIPGGGLFAPVYEGEWADAGTVPSLLRAAELAERDDRAGRLPAPVERPDA